MTEQEVKEIIAYAYPKAKFNAYSHTDEFMEIGAEIGKGFYYVSLYHERVDSNHIESRDGVIIVGNTYLSSFAYNLALAWLYESRNGTRQPGKHSALIKYNFKKFWGEQLYYLGSTVFSRAILLETLLYEQQLMIPLFREATTNAEWAATAEFVSSVMSGFVLFHELGHYYLAYQLKGVSELFAKYAGAIQPILDELSERGLLSMIDEVKCDMIAVLSLLMANGEAKATAVLQSAIMGQAALAALYSLQGAAEITMKDHLANPDHVDLGSFQTSTEEYSFKMGIAPDLESYQMLLRAELMAKFCTAVAREQGIDLYADKTFLDIDHNLLKDLLGYVNIVMDQDDVNQRDMARLVSEAFHRNPEGMEYLYMKSKVFKSARPLEP